MTAPFLRLDTLDSADHGVCAVRIEITEDEAAWIAALRHLLVSEGAAEVRKPAHDGMATFFTEDEDEEGSDVAAMHEITLVVEPNAIHFEGRILPPTIDESVIALADIPIEELSAHFTDIPFGAENGASSPIAEAGKNAGSTPESSCRVPSRRSKP